MSIILFLGGLVFGGAVVLGIPWWLGNTGVSAYWLLAIAIPVTLTHNVETKYNLFRSGDGSLVSRVFWLYLFPPIWAGLLLLIPYYVGRWMAA